MFFLWSYRGIPCNISKVFQDVIAYYETATLKLNISEDETQRGDFT
jgi:hypothetical protein